MSLSLSVPRRFHPGYSLLGRWIGVRVRDARMAEGAYLFALGVVLLVVLIVQNLAWGWLAPLDDPEMRLGFWLVQFVGLVLFAGVCLVGFRPGFVVRDEGDGLVIEQAGERIPIPHGAIVRVAHLPYLTYYRHYARFARTRAWIAHSGGEVLLIETREAPYVLGLPSEAHEALVARLQREVLERQDEVEAGVV